MKVTLKLTDDLLHAIAQENAKKRAYDVSCDTDNDSDAFYTIAFYEGAKFVLNQLEEYL
jgi:hypothetical protein